MCCDTPVVRISGVSKYFEIYEKPIHRLLQMFFRGRRKYYREYWALRDINFEVAQGECLGIIGRNGAGKSTLLQIITGTLSPSCGSVDIKGRVAALLELGSGFNPEFTGRENVYLNASILGLTRKEIDSKYQDILNFADIGEFIDQPVKSYSSGMVLRLAFAVVAHVDADVLIVDEALSVGDAFFTQKCMRFLRNFIKEKTLLFVSHDVAAVNSLCTRAVLLEAGQVKCIGDPKHVSETYLEDMYESSQGKGDALREHDSSLQQGTILLHPDAEDFRDMRQDFINSSNLRNDIKVFVFDDAGAAFGKGGATIEQVLLADDAGTPLNWIVGGEIVHLRVFCLAHENIFSPIIGFHLKDRLGQQLFGDNTFLVNRNTPLDVKKGQLFSAHFCFRMPILAVGHYSFAVAVAEGTQTEHVQHQWRHDAVILESVATSVTGGIMGIPMHTIELCTVDDNTK